MSEFRTERDSMGEVQVPARAYFGANPAGCRELPDFGLDTAPRH